MFTLRLLLTLESNLSLSRCHLFIFEASPHFVDGPGLTTRTPLLVVGGTSFPGYHYQLRLIAPGTRMYHA